MIPLDSQELSMIMQEYDRLREDGNSEMKAGWLACSSFGFTEIIKQNKNNVKLQRPEDNKYVIFSIHTEEVKPQEQERKTIARIHTEENVLDLEGGGDK